MGEHCCIKTNFLVLSGWNVPYIRKILDLKVRRIKMTISFSALLRFPMRERRAFGRSHRNWYLGIKPTLAAFNGSRCASRHPGLVFTRVHSRRERVWLACSRVCVRRGPHVRAMPCRLDTSVRSHEKEALSRRAPVAKRIGHHPYRRFLVYRGSGPPLVAEARDVCTRPTGFISMRSFRDMMDRCISVLIRSPS